MADQSFDVLVVGGGTAGIMVAAQLRRKKDNVSIGLIEPSEKHAYQPAWTLVGAGTYSFDKTIRKEADFIPKNVEWIKDYATTFMPDSNVVNTKSGKRYGYKYLVLAPGIQVNIDALPGLKEALGKDGVCSNYVDPEYTWEVLKNFKGGNALFTQPATPIKCGGAPQKIMYLADDHFRKSRIREKTEVIYATPGSVVFGVSPYKETINKVVERKGIVTKFFYVLTKIDPDKKEAHYKLIQKEGENREINITEVIREQKTGDDTVVIPYDMLHLAPPQSAPDFIKESPFANKDGWIDVDINTLQHKKYKNVFGLGDAAALPTAKTGAAVRKEAPVVVDNILHLMQENNLGDQKYEGYSSCPLVTGYGKMVLAEFKYNNERDSDPLLSKFVNTAKESWLMWLLKKYGLPYLYWNRMLKGKM